MCKSWGTFNVNVGSTVSIFREVFCDVFLRVRLLKPACCRWTLPENETPKDASYQVIADELMLDGNPRLNLASFVTTWMEPECDKLMLQSLNKNYIDMDEYPITTELQVALIRSRRKIIQPLFFKACNKQIASEPY